MDNAHKLFLEYYDKLSDDIFVYDNTMQLITEDSDISYYELRMLFTLLFKYTTDKDTKKILANVLKVLTSLEIRNKPVPTIKKLKSNSKPIFR